MTDRPCPPTPTQLPKGSTACHWQDSDPGHLLVGNLHDDPFVGLRTDLALTEEDPVVPAFLRLSLDPIGKSRGSIVTPAGAGPSTVDLGADWRIAVPAEDIATPAFNVSPYQINSVTLLLTEDGQHFLLTRHQMSSAYFSLETGQTTMSRPSPGNIACWRRWSLHLPGPDGHLGATIHEEAPASGG